ncbi:MAG: TolC family protein, partial [Gammaproteobacteria bacterium]|nr:TolC family protein [Gammaproteobacteria bacterium]
MRRARGESCGGHARSIAWTMLVSVASLLCGCATYHSKPLPEAPDLTRVPPLTVPAASFGLPGLPAAPFDPQRGLTETNIITLAVADNPRLKAERLRAGVARAQLLEAGLLPDPQLSGGMSWSAVRTGYDAALAGDIRALITRGAARGAAAAHARQVSLEILWREWQVAERARELYVQLDALDGLRAVLGERRRLLGRLYRRDRASLGRGEVTALAVTADFETWRAAEAQWRSFELEDNQALHALDELLGLAPGVRLPLQAGTQMQEPLTAAEYRAALAALPHRRPDLLALQAGYRSQEEKLREAILAQFPLASAGVTKARSAEEGVQTVGFNITLTLPLFDRNRGAIAIGRATRGYLRQSYQAALDDAESQADELREASRTMRRQLRVLGGKLPDL